MVPNVAEIGHSFKGAFAYYLHDKRQSEAEPHLSSSERVAWTETRNLMTDDAATAMRLMIATAKSADELKAAAGIKSTGRKATAGPVLAYSLAWHPDKEAAPDRAEMLRAADLSLKALKATNLQAVIICHTDTRHPHVHVVVNRIDPTNGKVSTGDEWRQLSKFRDAYEKERGQKLTYSWQEKQAAASAFDRAAKPASPPTPAKADKSPAAMLKELGTAQKARHKQEWMDLAAANKAAREAIYEDHGRRINAAAERHKIETKPMWSQHFREARQQERGFVAREQTISGVLRNAIAATTHQKITGSAGDRGVLSLTFANVLSSQARSAAFSERQNMNRQQLAGRLRGILDDEISGLKAERAKALQAQRATFDKTRADLIARQDLESSKIREAWRQMYADRGTAPDRASRRSTQPATRENPVKGEFDKAQRTPVPRGAAPTRSAFVSHPAPAPSPAGESPKPATRTAQRVPVEPKEPTVAPKAAPTREWRAKAMPATPPAPQPRKDWNTAAPSADKPTIKPLPSRGPKDRDKER